MAAAIARIRETVAPLDEDRPMGDEIELLAGQVAVGAFEMPGTA